MTPYTNMTLCMYSKPPGHYKPDKDQAGLVTPDNTNPTVHVRVPVLALFILVVDAVVTLFILVVADVVVILVILVVDPLGSKAIITKLRQKSLPDNQ